MTTGGFNPAEIFAIAREMEEEGLAFYKAVAGSVTDPDAKALFLKLASDEVQHVRDIERLEKDEADYFPEEADSLVAQYVQGLVDTKVFPPVADVPRIAGAADGLVQALLFGIEAETRSIEFYSRAKDEARADKVIETFARLAQQEKHHLTLLRELKTRLTSNPQREN